MSGTNTKEIVGTYISEEKDFTLKISECDYHTGIYKGTFYTKDSPLGEMTYDIQGQYTFSGSNRYPCMVGFSIALRPSGHWDYVFSDYWTGSRDEKGQILMSGARAYMEDNGLRETYSFDSIIFNLQ